MRSLSLLAVAIFVFTLPYTAAANVGNEISSGAPISASLDKAVNGGMNIADAVGEALVVKPEMAEKIIFMAVKKYSGFAGKIVTVAINSGVALRTVMIAAIKGAPDRSDQIIAAAIAIMPEQEDVISQYALDAGVPSDVIARAIASARIASAQTAGAVGRDGAELWHVVIPSRGRGGVVSPN